MMPGNNDENNGVFVIDEAETKEVSPASAPPQQPSAPMAQIDDEVERALNNVHETAPDGSALPIEPTEAKPNAQEDSMNRINQASSEISSSIKKFSADIDHKLQLSTKAKAIDEKTNFSGNVQRGWGNLRRWYSQSGLDDKRKQAATSFSSSVRHLDERLHVTEKASEVGKGVKEFDDKTKISEKVTSGFATGMEFVSSKLGGRKDGKPPETGF